MKAQIMLSMLLSLAIAASSVLFAVGIFVGAAGSYSAGPGPAAGSYANLGNTVMDSVQPYPEFHIVTADS